MAKSREEFQGAMSKLSAKFQEILRDGARAELTNSLELQKSLLEQHRARLLEATSKDPLGEAMQGQVKQFMTAALEVLKFQRDQRERMFQMQASLLDVYLGFLEEAIRDASRPAEGESPPTGKRKKGTGNAG